MEIFVFDTETTGFINKKETDLEKQPYLIQFAGIRGDIDSSGNFQEIMRINKLVKPKIPIPYNASQVHHIYDIDVQNAPTIEEIMEEFMSHINTPDMIIGHNIEYDESILKLELKRLKREYEYQPKDIFCTMKNTVNICQIKGNGERFKYPKLGELYKYLFGEFFIWAHDAMVDVEATLKCFIELYKTNKIKITQKKETLMSLF